MKKILWVIVLALYLVFSSLTAWAQPDIPPQPTKSIYVADFAGVLTPETKARINDTGEKLREKTKAQIVAVTIGSLEGRPIDEYSLAMLRKWGIGDKTLNNGVLLLVAVNDRKSRVEVGYGLEGALPDAKTGELQDDYMLPFFQQGDYNQGILNVYMALTAEVAKEYKVEVKTDVKHVKRNHNANTAASDEVPWWVKFLVTSAILLLLLFDWIFLGGTITFFLLSILRFRGGGGGGSGGGGYGGGSGGGGGSSRGW